MGIPIAVVPKPHSEKLCLVINPLTGQHSPNSFIPWSAVSVPLNNLHHFSSQLIAAQKCLGSAVCISLFKSDISGVYWHLPMHFLWQLFQVVTINGLRHVDHNNNFGNWGASGLWGLFMGLTLWIAIYVKHLSDLLTYVDDIFSYELEANLMWYPPFQKSLPTKQTHLLQLWDELGIPHNEPK